MEHTQKLPQVQRKLLRLHPSAFLLVSQFLLLISYAVFDSLYSQRALINAISVVVLVLVVWVINRSPAVTWITWALAIPSFVLSLLSAFSTSTPLLVGSSLLEAALYFYAAGCLIAYMMGDEQVTTDELFAIGATFTLLAWGFSYLYLVCQTLVPGSFASAAIPDRPLTFIELLFLSFSNLSSTGLSDIVPFSTWACILVMLEQFTGVGYVAMVVSRLIGLSTQMRDRRQK